MKFPFQNYNLTDSIIEYSLSPFNKNRKPITLSELKDYINIRKEFEEIKSIKSDVFETFSEEEKNKLKSKSEELEKILLKKKIENLTLEEREEFLELSNVNKLFKKNSSTLLEKSRFNLVLESKEEINQFIKDIENFQFKEGLNLFLRLDYLDDAQIEKLINFSEKNVFITELNLSSNDKVTDGKIAEVVDKSPNLSILCLDSKTITQEEVEEIVESLKKNNSFLTNLELRHCEISDKAADGIVEVLEKKILSRLVLVDNITSYKSKAMEKIANSLNNTALGTVVLSNMMFDEVIGKIAGAIEENETISSLNLANNGFDDKVVEKIAKSLAKNKSLTNLNLSNNSISDKGVMEFAKVLKGKIPLTHLDLSYCKITDKGAEEIAKTLRENQTLTNLNLYNNQISNKGAEEILKAFEENTSITKLNLHANKIDRGILKKIDSFLERNEKIAIEKQQQNLPNTSISDSRVQKISKEDLSRHN